MWQRPVSHPSVNPTVRIQLVLAWASRLTVFLSSPSQASMASSMLKKMIFLDNFREKDDSWKKKRRVANDANVTLLVENWQRWRTATSCHSQYNYYNVVQKYNYWHLRSDGRMSTPLLSTRERLRRLCLSLYPPSPLSSLSLTYDPADSLGRRYG